VVTSSRKASRLFIIARPNHSSSWRVNKLVIAALAVPCLAAGIGFTALGAWPILPLAGLELGALTAALYYVNWKLQYRHVITLDSDTVQIDKGFYVPRRSWQFDRNQAGLAVTPERHPWEGPQISLHGPGGSVSVGEFLNRDDALSLLGLLRAELRVTSHSPQTKVRI
jgi:uncharacterized membrane protein